MEAIVRFGVLAVVGAASAVVALPHLLTGGAASASHAAGPGLPVGVEDVPCRQLHVPPPQRKRLKPKAVAPLALEADHLPKLAPYSLPPRLMLRARAARPDRQARARAPRAAQLAPRALAEGAARAVREHRVAPGALALLLHTPHLGSPLLVFSAKGRSLEVQATRMWMTRRTLIALERAARRAAGRPRCACGR